MEVKAENVLGVVLAGGGSTRMGHDKALLQLNGTTLLARAISLLSGLGVADVVVSGNYPDCTSVPDQYGHIGPLGGVASIFSAIDNGELCSHTITHLLFLPVDMPLIMQPPLRRLLARGAEQRGCCYAESLFPMLVCFDAPVKQYLSQLIRGECSASMYAFIKHNQFYSLDITSEELAQFSNTNTPQQWQAVCNAMSANH